MNNIRLMKRILPVLIFIFYNSIVFAQYPFSGVLEKIAADEQQAARNLFRLERFTDTSGINIIQQQCYWNINPEVRYISGHVNTFFIPLKTGLNTITLDLSDSLTVDSVVYKNSVTSFTHSANVLQIHFPEPLTKGSIFNADIHYHGEPDNSGFGSFVTSKHGADSTAALWTLSEPFGASDWFPCKNSLTDKIDSLDIIVTTPEAYQCAANGTLDSTVTEHNQTTYYWKHRYPVAAYLVGIAVTKYFVYTDRIILGDDTIKVMNFVWHEDSANARKYIPDLYPAMAIFDSLFSDYPFKKEKYGHAQFGWGGGMEHQTISFVANYDFELLAHECAHQWFGDKITCNSWSDIFLNEGFAVFCTGLCYENLFDGKWWYPWRRQNIDKVTSEPGGSVWVGDTTSVNKIFNYRTTYIKGGMILHQLRHQIGDKAFFKGVKNYITDLSLSYNFADIDDLKVHLEQTSGKDLTYYFNQWYYGQGFPSYHAEWSQNKNGLVHIQLKQTQSDSSVGFFKLNVPVKLKNSNTDTTIYLAHSFSGEEYEFMLPFQADSLIIDPELWLITAGNTVRKIPVIPDESSVTVFPNPSSGELNIQCDNPFDLIKSIELYDIIGIKVFYSTVTLLPDQNATQFDFSPLPKGIYLLKVITKKNVMMKKWSKVR